MFVKGYEPNLSALVGLRGAMERVQSVPLDDRMVGNPFWPQKVRDECKLQASRPSALPVDGGWSEKPDQTIAGGNRSVSSIVSRIFWEGTWRRSL